MSNNAIVQVRRARAEDRPYLTSTIRETLIRNSAHCQGLPPSVIDQLIEPVLATFDTVVITPDDDANTILAFLVYQGQTVAFAYTRARIRRKGFARHLLAHAKIKPGPVDAVFLTTKVPSESGSQSMNSIARAAGYEPRYRPYLPLTITAAIHGSANAS